mmetsp:Transcript_5332/g.16779  ORF Transcript_5332/g.16779 Transcript_5332/m.16779 type:complete len:278 (-) Transcript_5332:4253-5086(-)
MARSFGENTFLGVLSNKKLDTRVHKLNARPDTTFDAQIHRLIKEGVAVNQRSLFTVVAERGWEHVVSMHNVLAYEREHKPSVLWCYQHDLGFATHGKKGVRAQKKARTRGVEGRLCSDGFDTFISETPIRWCYYKDSATLLGSTFGCVVLQDFEALTPNVLARAIETVDGGGIIIFLISSVVASLSFEQSLCTLMDVQASHTTANTTNIDRWRKFSRFQHRLILSLSNCARCMVSDGESKVYFMRTRRQEHIRTTTQPTSQLKLEETKHASLTVRIR